MINRSAWGELRRPSASSSMNGWDAAAAAAAAAAADDDDDYDLNMITLENAAIWAFTTLCHGKTVRACTIVYNRAQSCTYFAYPLPINRAAWSPVPGSC